jgi:hypothetical protein
MSSIKPVTVSTAICQRPGTSSRLSPPATNSMTRIAAISIHIALLVKERSYPATCQRTSGSMVN